MNKKVLLAYSGGLDTSVILKWLLQQGYEVSCFIADIGQKEDFKAMEQRALQVGAKAVYIQDLKKPFLEEYVFPALMAHATYEGRYLLGTALARPITAKALAQCAKEKGITAFAHGATGKGNDQVRFELTILKLMPKATLITPWKDPLFLKEFTGRSDLIAYAQKHNIPITSSLEKPYSIDENLMHTSFEGGKLEDPLFTPPEEIFIKSTSPQKAPDQEIALSITFEKGVPISVSHKGQNISEPLALFNFLNEKGGALGIGRQDLIESRFVGLKSRGIYETPAGSILLAAHRDLEALTLDREVILLKEGLAPKIAQLIYNGFWFSPEMEFLMAAILQSQQYVTGTVHLTLYKGNVIITGRSSPYSLYNPDLASMDTHGGYDQTDAKGFIKLQALRLVGGSRG